MQSESGDEQDRKPQTEPADDEATETPFDHPLFLPVILLGLTIWFFWDGFVDPMVEHLAFNRGGFAVLALATAWFGYKGLQEMRERSARDAARPDAADDDRQAG